VDLKQDDVSWGPNAVFSFPKKDGTGAIWEAMARKIPDGRIHLSREVVEIDVKNKVVRCADGATERYDHLISTMPVTHLTRFCKLGKLEPLARGLKHTHVKVAGVAPRHALPPHMAGKTWVYCPGNESFYRLTPFSDFSPDHVPDRGRYCSVLCETSFPPGTSVSDAALFGKTFDSLNAGGLLEADPAATHTYMMDAPHGYPIPTVERDAILGAVLPELEKLNIYSRGRFGGWKYEAGNMDHSVMQGVEAVDRIMQGTPEKTLATPDVVNAGKV
jgi:protoporphyrinogen oxidase